MLVQVVIATWQGRFAAVPGARVNEQPVAEYEEVGVASITKRHAESVHFLPGDSQILAAQHDDAGGGVHHVTVGAAAEGQPDAVAEPAQVGERIVFAVPEGSSHA